MNMPKCTQNKRPNNTHHYVHRKESLQTIRMLENSGGSIDGCIIGQEQNSNKKALAFTQIHSLEIRIKNQKDHNLFAPQYYSTYAIRASYFSYAFKKTSFGCNLEVLQSKNCCLVAPFANVILNADI